MFPKSKRDARRIFHIHRELLLGDFTVYTMYTVLEHSIVQTGRGACEEKRVLGLFIDRVGLGSDCHVGSQP